MTETRPTVAVFRPDDDRLTAAVETLESLGVDPLGDPMLAVEPGGTTPRTDADYVILTSKTGVELAAAQGWDPAGTTVCAIGESTADALEQAGYAVDIVPEEFTSRGLVDRLAGEVDGARLEVARSDHGSAVLLDGLEAAGAYVHETILYRLVRPDGAGVSVERAVSGDLDGALFTSSLTVEHFVDIASERGVRDDAIAGLNDAVVGTIGPPTKDTAEALGIEVDVVPADADFEQLARAAIEFLDE
ncbi:uroporphyrinogen-III synthase [Salinibaculum salinum]|uniref:uroporphyrinogen-III synthase n=1 Tax=Salinibaculum salinum TaxID=3131996 RepID=UPI0030EFA3EF